jgi:hypothetical protein
MWSDTPGKLSSTGYSRNDSTFLKSYHSLGNVVRNISQYSLVARSEAMRRRFVEKRSWEDAAPPLKDPNRIPAPSTLRRWCGSLDSSHSTFPRLCRAVQTVAQWLDHGDSPVVGSLRLSWPTVYPFLRVVWPWPLRR